MAATNYTPIQLYYSTTASAAPTSGNLASGELAINITDGKLYYKDNGGVVQVIATKGAGTIGGSTTQIQYNNAGALAGSAAMTFNSGTNTTTLTTLNLTNALGATYGGTAQSAYTQGDILYASATNTLSKLAVGTVNYILTSTGSVPQWVAPTSVTVNTATNLAGGAAGSVPYQSGAATTTFLAIGAADRVMTSSGTAPQWVTSLTGLTGVSSSSITNTSLTSGRLVYSSTSGLETDSANLTFNGTTLSTTGLSNTGFSTLVKTLTLGDSNFNGTAVFAPATPAKMYFGTGTVTDVTSAASATNVAGAVVAMGITPIAATNASVTYTNASTLYIAGAPSAGTNVTLTNPYSLYIAAGAAYFGGAVTTGALTVSNLTDSALTAGRVTYAGTGGLLSDSALFTWSTSAFTSQTATTTFGSGTTSSNVQINVAGAATTATYQILGGGSGNPTWDVGTSAATTSWSWGYTLSSSRSELMRLNSTGLVINPVNSAVSKLDVYGPSGVTSFTGTTRLGVTVQGSTSTNDYSGIDFTQGANTPRARIASYFAGAGSYLTFGTSNSYASGITNGALLINPSGYVTLGSVQSASTLAEVYNNGGGATPQFRLSTYDGGSSTAFGLGFYITSYGYDIARITGRFTSSGGGGYGDLDFKTSFNGSVTTKATISQWGTLSVGTTDTSPYTSSGSASGQSNIVTYNTTSRNGDIILVKGDSGTASQNTHLVNFKNYGPAATGRASGTQLGGMYFQASQPSSGALQDAASILCIAETQTGNSTSSGLGFYTNYLNNGNALRMYMAGGGAVSIGLGQVIGSGLLTVDSYGEILCLQNAATANIYMRHGVQQFYGYIDTTNVSGTGFPLSFQKSGGYAGFGSGLTNPTHTLQVQSTASSSQTLYVSDGTRALNVGTWDGTNMRMEASGGPLLITSYNTGGVILGYSGSTNLVTNSTIPCGVSTSSNYQAGDSFACGGRANIQTSSANVVNAYAAGSGYGGAASVRAASERSAGTGMYFFQGVSSATSDGSTGTQNIIIYNNGNIQNTNNSYGSLSDAKLKKDVVRSGSQWDDVKALAQLVSKFTLIDDVNQTRQIGWVAQDVRPISPGLVYETPDFEMDSEGKMVETGTVTLNIQHSVANMKAFKALGEALERIEQLEARLAAANIH